MDKDKLKSLLDKLNEDNETVIPKAHDRVLIIDGLNLFFRNFASINKLNPEGVHVGGLGGFFRSLGYLINSISPTCVYVVFDGEGGSLNRKNLISEYKSGRGLTRVNWDVFDTIEEEEHAKFNQIVRIVQYLKQLPVKVISLDKTEADDVISVLSMYLPKKYNSNCYIVSSDKDFLQLVNKKVIVYRPMERVFYNEAEVFKKFNVPPSNFLIYKMLLGDNSDKLDGIKGLGKKTIPKHFPELKSGKVSFEDLLDICESRLTTHVCYARVLQDEDRLRKTYKIMDLSKPMISEKERKYVKQVIESNTPKLQSENFKTMYFQDKLGEMIKNLDLYLSQTFAPLQQYK